jgi:protein gp37
MPEPTVPSWADATFAPWIHRAGPGPQLARAHDATWDKPLRWNSVATQFRASHGRRRRVLCGDGVLDVFSPAVNPIWLADLVALIEATPELDWILPTWNIENVRGAIYEACDLARARTGVFSQWRHDVWPANVWLGATVTRQADALRMIPELMALPAQVRFLRLEPLLGPVDFYACAVDWAQRGRNSWFRTHILHGIDWVVAGGETGPDAQAVHPHWVGGLRSQCISARVPFFFEGWGEWLAIDQGPEGEWWDSLYRSNRRARGGESQGAIDELYGRTCTVPQLCLRHGGDHVPLTSPMAFLQGTWPVQAFRVGAAAAGRLLDGRTWDGLPRTGG